MSYTQTRVLTLLLLGPIKDINLGMKLLFFLSIFITIVSCSEISKTENNSKNQNSLKAPVIIDNTKVLKEQLVLNQLEGKWYYNGVPYSGYSLKFHPNDTLGEKLGFYEGKREGIAKKWSENGVLRVESFYKQNRLDCVYKTWWENGVLASQSHYTNGVKQGLENEWYPTGQLAKARQLVDGSENGLQKAWLPNGKLYINYEARNGRIFGLQRANSCYKLENEKVVIKDEVF